MIWQLRSAERGNVISPTGKHLVDIFSGHISKANDLIQKQRNVPDDVAFWSKQEIEYYIYSAVRYAIIAHVTDKPNSIGVLRQFDQEIADYMKEDMVVADVRHCDYINIVMTAKYDATQY